jgi:hypothetical protein
VGGSTRQTGAAVVLVVRSASRAGNRRVPNREKSTLDERFVADDGTA